MKTLVSFTIIAIFSFPANCLQSIAGSQDQPKSLADLAHENKKQKVGTQSKLVVTNESISSGGERELDELPDGASPQGALSLPSRQSLIPKLFHNDADNSDEVLKAIEDLKNKRGARETEAEIHAWYDRYDGIMLTALQKWNELIARGEELKQSPQQNESLGQAAKDLQLAAEGLQSTGLALRLQMGLAKVRLGIARLGIDAVWFKLRCPDGSYAPCKS